MASPHAYDLAIKSLGQFSELSIARGISANQPVVLKNLVLVVVRFAWRDETRLIGFLYCVSYSICTIDQFSEVPATYPLCNRSPREFTLEFTLDTHAGTNFPKRHLENVCLQRLSLLTSQPPVPIIRLKFHLTGTWVSGLHWWWNGKLHWWWNGKSNPVSLRAVEDWAEGIEPVSILARASCNFYSYRQLPNLLNIATSPKLLANETIHYSRAGKQILASLLDQFEGVYRR